MCDRRLVHDNSALNKVGKLNAVVASLSMKGFVPMPQLIEEFT